MARDHRKLKAFQLADALVIAVYRATRAFPDEERFGLTSQMRRAAVSAAANIVEGAARETEADFLRFLDIALASLRELGYYVDLSGRLRYLSDAEAAQLRSKYDEAARVLQGLIRSLRGVGHAP
ncbi:MAG: four helix bundle protein [Planctomycetota bacterium]|nr:four helix bundle protein [Planctomycetota bacterium]